MFLRAAPGDGPGFGTRAFHRPCSSVALYIVDRWKGRLTRPSFHFLTSFAAVSCGKIVASSVIKKSMAKDKPVKEREIVYEPIPPEKGDPATVLQRINEMLKDFHLRHEDAKLPVIA